MKDNGRKYRYTILTYNFNGYEIFREVETPQDDVEYIYVTDDKNLTSKTWRIVYDKDLEGMSVFDKCYSVRFNLFKYASTDICIRIDGDIAVLSSPDKLVRMFEEGGYDMAATIHPFRNQFAEEYAAWIKMREYPKEQAVKCLNYFYDNGYDIRNRFLIEGMFVIERRCKVCEEITKRTFDVLKKLGSEEKIERLDQTVTSFVIGNYFGNKLKLMPLSGLTIHSHIFRIYHHNSPNILYRNIWYNGFYEQWVMNKLTKLVIV